MWCRFPVFVAGQSFLPPGSARRGDVDNDGLSGRRSKTQVELIAMFPEATFALSLESNRIGSKRPILGRSKSHRTLDVMQRWDTVGAVARFICALYG